MHIDRKMSAPNTAESIGRVIGGVLGVIVISLMSGFAFTLGGFYALRMVGVL